MTNLSKEQYIRLSDIFHQQYDKWAETKGGPIPVASFAAVVGMVEAFNIRKQPAPEQMEFSNAFIEALEEVIRISDREHDAWNEVKAFLTKQRKNKSHD